MKLAKLVPVARKSLEAFILAIREKLSKSNSLDAMWVGNLKHRDLSGNHISSQYHPAETTELSAKRAKTTS